jgi:hypothetical protein
MALEDRARHRKLVLLLHRQSTEQVMGAGRDIALGVALQKHQGPLGIAVEQRRGGGEAQDVGVTRLPSCSPKSISVWPTTSRSAAGAAVANSA